MSEKIYAERDIIGMDSNGGHYCRHISAMTREDLHSKSDIAAELGFRDMVIAGLEAKCAALAAESLATNDRLQKLIQIISNADNDYCMCGDAMKSHVHGGCGHPTGMFDYHYNQWLESDKETPATDAFLAEMRAQGVAMVIAYHRERAEALHHVDRNNAIRHSMAALDASDVAAKLRQDANTAELVAAGIITKVGE